MSKVNLQSVNFPDHFIRHQNFRAKLMKMDNLVGDFSFTLVRRGEHLVALRSVNFPDRMLRHRDFEIHLDVISADDLFVKDSTFHFETGLADSEGVSFRSVNFPDRYLRHRNFLLYLEAPAGPDDELFRRDATFVRKPAAVLIDNGPVLVPVQD